MTLSRHPCVLLMAILFAQPVFGQSSETLKQPPFPILDSSYFSTSPITGKCAFRVLNLGFSGEGNTPEEATATMEAISDTIDRLLAVEGEEEGDIKPLKKHSVDIEAGKVGFFANDAYFLRSTDAVKRVKEAFPELGEYIDSATLQVNNHMPFCERLGQQETGDLPHPCKDTLRHIMTISHSTIRKVAQGASGVTAGQVAKEIGIIDSEIRRVAAAQGIDSIEVLSEDIHLRSFHFPHKFLYYFAAAYQMDSPESLESVRKIMANSGLRVSLSREDECPDKPKNGE